MTKHTVASLAARIAHLEVHIETLEAKLADQQIDLDFTKPRVEVPMPQHISDWAKRHAAAKEEARRTGKAVLC